MADMQLPLKGFSERLESNGCGLWFVGNSMWSSFMLSQDRCVDLDDVATCRHCLKYDIYEGFNRQI